MLCWCLTWTLAFGFQWYCILHTRNIGKKHYHKLFQHVMQNFRGSLVNLLSDVAAFSGGIKKSLWTRRWKTSVWMASFKLPIECHCWLPLNILPSKNKLASKYSLLKLLNFHWQVGSLSMLHHGPGNYFSTIILYQH